MRGRCFDLPRPKKPTCGNRAQVHLAGRSKGASLELTGGKGFDFFIAPILSSVILSPAIRCNSSEAGSSFGSCGTSLPRTARLKMVWRRALIWSGRVVRRARLLRAKVTSCRNVSGSGAGALRWAKLAVASRSRVPPAQPAPPPTGRRAPSVRRLWRQCGVVRRGVGRVREGFPVVFE